jgi:SAM-dependent methyltransferase
MADTGSAAVSDVSPGRPTSPDDASPWVRRFASLIPRRGRVLDVAAGGGRHTRWLAARGWSVVAVDRDTSTLLETAARDGCNGCGEVEVVEADLEDGDWPFPGRWFDGVVVTNYLHRPLLPTLVGSVAPGGALLYETYAVGHERYGRPTNPDWLLQPGELLEVVRGQLTVVAYEDVTTDKPARVQRLAAVREE